MRTQTQKTKLVLLASVPGIATFAHSVSAHAGGKTDVPQYAGALTFAPDGTLFVGDNISSAVFAYKTALDQPEPVDPKAPPLEIESIDNQIAPVIRGKVGQIEINGMAVHHDGSRAKSCVSPVACKAWDNSAHAIAPSKNSKLTA